MTYIVTVQSTEQYHPHYEANFDNEEKAVEQAEKWAEEHQDKKVFIEFRRASDGQVGYINRDGADITGKSWTSE